MASPYTIPQSLWNQLGLSQPQLGPMVASTDDSPWIPYAADLPKPDAAPLAMPKKAPKPASPAIPAESSSLDVPMGMDAEMAQQFQDQLANRQANVDSQDEALKQFKGGGKSGLDAVNLKPLLAYADSLYGTKTADSYETPETPDQRNQKLLTLEQAAQKSRGDLSDDQMNYLKMKADNATKLQHYQALADQANMRADLLRQGLDVRKQGLGLREDVAAGNVGEKFNSGLMKQYQNTLENLNRAEGIINGKDPVTATTFALLQSDFINAMAPGGAATDSKTAREMIEDYQTKVNHLQQKFGNIQDLRKADPDTVNYLRNLLGKMKIEFQAAQSRQAKNIGDAHSSATSPKIQSTVKSNMAKYPMPTEPGGTDDAAAKQKRLDELELKAKAGN